MSLAPTAFQLFSGHPLSTTALLTFDNVSSRFLGYLLFPTGQQACLWNLSSTAHSSSDHPLAMVNLPKLTAFLTYDLMPVTYKPIPGSSASVSPFSSSSWAGNTTNLQAHLHRRLLGEYTKRSAVKTLDAAADCSVEPYDAPPVLKQTFPPYDQTSANVYRYRQQQGVNLGSWFVHESWMTPSLFRCASGPKVSEADIAYGWGSTANARSVLERHWDTFIQESDFKYLASIGINTVRLPIGHWSLGRPEVVRAINWAGENGIGVLVDLHGAVGSQNGQPHSGVSDGNATLFSVQQNMDKTVDVLAFLAKELAPVNNVVGIQLLNEPNYDPGLEDFYTRGIGAIRDASPHATNLPLYLHDGFDLDRFANYVASRSDFVVQDHHSYFVFSPSDKIESGLKHTDDVDGAVASSLRAVSKKVHRNLVIAEWSCALTPESLELDKDASQVRKKFCEEQMKVYTNTTAGWAFWSYKTEDCKDDSGWCFTKAVGKSLSSTFFSYGKQVAKKTQLAKDVSAIDDAASELLMPTIAKNLLELPSRHPHNDRRASTDSAFHRFAIIHRKRGDKQDQDSKDGHNSTMSDGDGSKIPMERSVEKGYNDGLTTAQAFASYNMSKLGFISQFINDAITVAGPSHIEPGTEGGYSDGFLQGLKDGELIAGASGG
ncbi:unnamed protein product [Cyclocybe aegerita]|uniref:Glycoside hydrolase family 5 domain-containing protein n=1 Tax=Cyclocybe aegerita TaxID=1973307 RepID=A0A8S0VWP8_CYCAE|nr:unnamed protein product [Cyclocybe aegerita]